jgi:histone-lysine N-methyltransferase SETD2
MGDVEQPTVKMGSIKLEDPAASSGFDAPLARNGHSIDDLKDQSSTSTRSPDDTKAPSDSASTPDTAVSLKQSKKASQKSTRRAPVLYDHLDDVTEAACQAFQVIPDCIYGKKDMGSTNNDALDCDCKEEWRM